MGGGKGVSCRWTRIITRSSPHLHVSGQLLNVRSHAVVRLGDGRSEKLLEVRDGGVKASILRSGRGARRKELLAIVVGVRGE